MDFNLLRHGTRMTFSQHKTYEELDEVLSKIFTNNPYFWGSGPMYFDSNGELNNVVKGMVTGKINVYEHQFPFVEPDERNPAEITLYNYCFDISKARSNPLLPLVYYNAFLYMDELGLSMHKTDNVSKIMYVRKNKYKSILEEINKRVSRFDWYSFRHYSNNFEDFDKHISCECGAVEAYRIESGMFYGNGEYIIFPFPTDDELIGRMYYFEKEI